MRNLDYLKLSVLIEVFQKTNFLSVIIFAVVHWVITLAATMLWTKSILSMQILWIYMISLVFRSLVVIMMLEFGTTRNMFPATKKSISSESLSDEVSYKLDQLCGEVASLANVEEQRSYVKSKNSLKKSLSPFLVA